MSHTQGYDNHEADRDENLACLICQWNIGFTMYFIVNIPSLNTVCHESWSNTACFNWNCNYCEGGNKPSLKKYYFHSSLSFTFVFSKTFISRKTSRSQDSFNCTLYTCPYHSKLYNVAYSNILIVCHSGKKLKFRTIVNVNLSAILVNCHCHTKGPQHPKKPWVKVRHDGHPIFNIF